MTIYYLNDHQGIIECLRNLLDEGLGLSVISLAELYEGVYYSRDPEGDEHDLNDFLRGVTVLGVDDAICQIFGKERGRLRAAGIIVGDLALRIGATALHHDLKLLANNRRHFERIDSLHIESF